MKNTLVIIKKQLKDTIKNKTILIQFLLFPVMALIMENAVSIDNMPNGFFVKLFSIMYIGMAPLTATSSIIAEEKEKNTLKVLTMANVKAWEYLLGIGIYVLAICMAGALVMSTLIDKDSTGIYLLGMCIGFVISILAGACIGVYSNNQMKATSLVMPTMLVLAFAPMIAMFNEDIKKFADLFYTQQISNVFDTMKLANNAIDTMRVIGINAILLIVIFAVVYKRKGLE